MNFTISASTDIGLKKVNQDSLFVRKIVTNTGEIVFAVLCDGMGGLQKGELASASIISAFTDWMYIYLPQLAQKTPADDTIREHWCAVISKQNNKIRVYSQAEGAHMGSTITAFMITGNRYYLMNIGDSRAYELTNDIIQLTEDHTVLNQEVQRGNMTAEQAMKAVHKNVLTRCVGINEDVFPDMFFGEPKKNTLYLLCSDGFRNKITESEMLECFRQSGVNGESDLKRREEQLIDLNKRRGERDNISVITIATH